MPLTRLRPLDMKLLFDDRPYKLGDTIDIVVELSARGDIEVREARVDLVCEEHYVESYNVMVPDIKTGRPTSGGLYGGGWKILDEADGRVGEAAQRGSWLCIYWASNVRKSLRSE